MNRLAQERSPYLLQHASNPVDWYPWGDEAFDKAAAREQAHLPVDRLLDLPLVPRDGARVVREPGDCRGPQRRFRVDQGRPRGAAGRRPRLHGVRPVDDRIRRMADDGLPDAGAQAVLWRHVFSADVTMGPSWVPGRPQRARTRVEARSGAGRLCGGRAVRSAAVGDGRRRTRQGGSHRRRASTRWPTPSSSTRNAFDRQHGGFGDAPKFPRPSELLLLLREHARTGADAPLTMATETLRAMAIGGMRDHVGGGFHRYSVDARLARSALREDALRPGAAGAGVPRSGSGHARRVLFRGGGRHAGVRASGFARNGQRPMKRPPPPFRSCVRAETTSTKSAAAFTASTEVSLIRAIRPTVSQRMTARSGRSFPR